MESEDLAKCFANFYSVQTDEMGRFFLLANGKVPLENISFRITIVPLDFENSKPINEMIRMTVIQEFYEYNVGDPIDKYCQFVDYIVDDNPGGTNSQFVQQINHPAATNSQSVGLIGHPAGTNSQLVEQINHLAGTNSQLLEQINLPAGTNSQLVEQINHLAGTNSQLLEQINLPAGTNSQFVEQINLPAGTNSQSIGLIGHPVGTNSQLVEQINHPDGTNYKSAVQQQCQINYSKTLDQRAQKLNDLILLWLSRTGSYYEFTTKKNFFLIANFRDFLDTAKRHEQTGTSIKAWEASFIGQFLNGFARTRKNGNLWKRLRLVDQRMISMIDEFCEISVDFLISNQNVAAEIAKTNEPEKFCAFWPKVKENASKFTQIDIAVDAFNKWINTSDQLSNEQEQIITFWAEVFCKRLESCCYNWPELDEKIFAQIGQVFTNAKREQILTLDKLERLKSVRINLDKICAKIDRMYNQFRFQLPNTWKNELCANEKFQYITQYTTRAGKRKQCENAKICKGCKNEERKIAFDPCGHFFLCKKCAKTIKTCSECKAKVMNRLEIFNV
ncbi:hypothetical protein niasHT_017343 [Heterodera trifolii]|uniref:RING-type domain-containing protein n=1 Tax=Heterodera trifolii TaxID=157864 RepID=A0ABD2L417_9BILA